MKYLMVLFLSLVIINCKPKQAVISDDLQNMLTTNCPLDGACTFEVLKDKSLKILKTDLEETYAEIREGHLLILKFEYKRNEIPDTIDGQYIEQVFIELNPNNLKVDLKDSELKKAKVMFARFCYCKGQTGYYVVTQGNLSIKKIEDKGYQLNLDFKQDKVPQIITQIHEIFYLD